MGVGDDAVESGGYGFDDKTATAIYGLYTAAVFMAALPGGWIADRLLGQRRAVLYGGVLIACGHFSMAVPSMPSVCVAVVVSASFVSTLIM